MKVKEMLSQFIERTLLGWPKGYRHYYIGDKSYSCYETDEQWELHLQKIDEENEKL